MLGFRLISALQGLGVLAWAAPTTPATKAIDGYYPPSCIPIIFKVLDICIIAPPTSTIGPSTKRDDGSGYTSQCIPLILEKWNICILGPPISTIGSSTMRHDEVDPNPDIVSVDPSTGSISSGDDDDNDDDPTHTVPVDCIPSVYEEFNICIVGPATSTLVPSSKHKHRRVWIILGSATVGALVPDEAVPGGVITPDSIVSGGAITLSS